MKRPPQIPISDSDWQRTPTAVQVLLVSSSERVGLLEQVVEQQAARVASLEEELARRKGRSRRECPGRLVAIGRFLFAAHRRLPTPILGALSGRAARARRTRPLVGTRWRTPGQAEYVPRMRAPVEGDDPHGKLRAEVIEYQVHTLRCAHCDRLTAAGWPEGVSRHTLPSVQAWVSLLAGAYRLSKRNIRALLSDAFGLKVSLGTVSRLEQEVARPWRLRSGGARLRSPTGHRQRTDRLAATPRQAWLWTAVTDGVTVAPAGERRGRCITGGGPDRYGLRASAAWTPASLRATAARLRGVRGPPERVGHHLLDRSEQLFTWWHQVREVSRARFQDHIDDLCLRFRFHLCYGQRFADAKTAAT